MMRAGELKIVDDVCRLPVLVPEDTLARWQTLKQCLKKYTDLKVVQCPTPCTDILKHCSRLMPCILAIEQASIDQLNPNRLKKTIDFGNSVCVLVRVIKEDAETVGRLLRLGCMGFVTERASPSVVDQALRALAKREIWVNAQVLADFVRSLLTNEGPRNLTSRETQILDLISRGRTNREIAAELLVSRETVRWHIRTLYAKIGVHSRTEAVNQAPMLRAAR
jgi:two-component system, NarL family, response regulator LiaR